MSHTSVVRFFSALRRTVGPGLLGGLAVLAACEPDNKPCTACPPLEGRYDVSFESTSTTGSCQGVNPPSEGTLQLSRRGSALGGSFPPYEALTGTLYASGDFTLSGSGRGDGGTPSDRVSIRGSYRADVRDGGVTTLDGTWLEVSQRSSPSGPTTCSLHRAFTGTRQ
jgi:hypothetical protein